MKAGDSIIPNVIYINAEAAIDLAYNPGENDNKEEYIHKNTFLKWLNQARKSVSESDASEQRKVLALSVLQRIENKINTM